MKLTSLLRLLEETFTAAAFAEAGEHETALAMLDRKESDNTIFRACSARRKPQTGTLPVAA